MILQVLVTRMNGQNFYLNSSLKLQLPSKTYLLEMTQVNTMCLFRIPLKQMFMPHLSMLMTRMCGFILLLASMVLYIYEIPRRGWWHPNHMFSFLISIVQATNLGILRWFQSLFVNTWSWMCKMWRNMNNSSCSYIVIFEITFNW